MEKVNTGFPELAVMQPPIDYPIIDDASCVPQARPMTYAVLLDLYAAEQPITEDMIQAACRGMETAQQLPFAAKPVPVGIQSTAPRRTDDVLARLLKAIRHQPSL